MTSGRDASATSARETLAPGACRICGDEGRHSFTTTDRNRVIGDRRFEYRTCRACATLYLAAVPADLGRYYPPDYYPLGDCREGNAAEQAKLALLRRFVRGGTLTEIGPGAGGFVTEAQRGGFAVRAIEMDARVCEHLRAIGVETLRSDAPHEPLAQLTPSRAIVLWHVFEHLGEPVELLRAAAANLEPGGVLLIAVPNPAAFGLRVLGARWPHVDAPRHLQFVPAGTLLRLGRAVDLTPLALLGADRAGRDWNVFGWQQLLLRPHSGPRRRRAAFVAGALLAEALAAIERHGLRGSTYTVVFRKDEPE